MSVHTCLCRLAAARRHHKYWQLPQTVTDRLAELWPGAACCTTNIWEQQKACALLAVPLGVPSFLFKYNFVTLTHLPLHLAVTDSELPSQPALVISQPALCASTESQTADKPGSQPGISTLHTVGRQPGQAPPPAQFMFTGRHV